MRTQLATYLLACSALLSLGGALSASAESPNAATPAANPTAEADAYARYLSGDAHIMLSFDLQRFQRGVTPKRLLNMLMTDPTFKTRVNLFQTQFGVNIFTDVRALTAEVTLSLSQPPEILLFLDGRFNATQFIAGLNQAGHTFTQEKIGESIAYSSAVTESSVSFIEGGALMGSPSQVREALKRGSSSFRGPLVAQRDQLTRRGDLWFVAAIPDELRAPIKAKNPALSDTQALRGSLDFAEGLNIEMVTEFVKPESAAKITEVITQRLAEAKRSPQAAMFMSMLNKVSATSEGTNLTLTLPLSQDDMNQIQAIVSMLLMSLTMNQQQGQGQGAGGQAPLLPLTSPSPQAKPAPRFPTLTQPTSPSAPPPAKPEAPAR